MSTPTLDEIRQWPATVSVPKAASALGISPRMAYVMVARGDFPARVLPFGTTRRIVTASLVALLEAA